MTIASAPDAGLRSSGPVLTRAKRGRALWLGLVSGVVLTATATLLVPLGLVTFFRARRLYAAVVRVASRSVLWLYGIRITVQPETAFPRTQVVYVSNHTSTLDLFILVALGLPNTRFFLSGFLRKLLPLGVVAWMMGTFFTVPQDRPAERTRIFQRATAVLRRTRESVYLSPEGGRIATGAIGHFNKGAFHLAMALNVSIVPMYIHIPADVDPGLGYDARPGTVTVHVLPAIRTDTWRPEDLQHHVRRVREVFVQAHEVFRCG